MYKLISENCVLRLSDGCYIPLPQQESEGFRYQEWLNDGNTPAPVDPVPNPRISEIHEELNMIDLKSIRALREGDTMRIEQWEAQAEVLRDELASL